ncbi:MAG TPA: hypothetical protein VI819_03790 [Patescibacteria group bacterium]|nr:hypothetical protein [Patescibacteria group bacterium]
MPGKESLGKLASDFIIQRGRLDLSDPVKREGILRDPKYGFSEEDIVILSEIKYENTFRFLLRAYTDLTIAKQPPKGGTQ